jgi:hypothetical protein
MDIHATKKSTSLPKRFSRPSGCVTRSIAGETIIVPVSGHVADLESIYTLNEVGSALWELIDGQTPLSRIVAELCEIYEVSQDEAAQDAAAFMEELKTAGLVIEIND